MDTKKIDYAVVSEFAGHRSCEAVAVESAVKDIYGCVKEKGMVMAIDGQFQEFANQSELKDILEAQHDGVSIRIFDELVGG
jgi:hypothetical protein